jgi:hypothetical protein
VIFCGPVVLAFRCYRRENTFVGSALMNRDYDIFEKLPGGDVVWRAFVPGLENARAKLQNLAKNSENEFFAIHTPTKEIVVRVNSSEPASE